MSKLPSNRIESWRAKHKHVDIFLHDASGAFQSLELYNHYLYAKKYPIQPPVSPFDISIGSS